MLTQEQKDFLITLYKGDQMSREELVAIWPELIPILFDFKKPLKLIDLSYLKCIYNYKNTPVNMIGMWMKKYDVDLINGRAQFNHDNKRFETSIVFFEPNNL